MELVALNDKKEPVTTSLKVAKDFGKNHQHVLEKIRKLSVEISTDLQIDGYNPKFTECTYIDSWNRPQIYFEMNRDAFVELVGNMNTAKARVWKRKYHAAFNKMEQALKERAIDFHSMRQITIDSTKRLHAVIDKVVIPTARADGSKTAGKWFHANYEKLINKTVGVSAGQRPNLSYGLQSDIARLDEVIEANIVKQAKAGATHREIYSSTKDTVQSYAKAALLSERSATIQIALF